MSNFTTRWILELKDQISAGIKAATSSTKLFGSTTTDVLAKSAIAWNQATEMVAKFSNALNFSEEYQNVAVGIQRMTGASGAALDEASAKVHRLSAIYGDEGEEISRSANAMSKAMGISFNEALSLAEEGYKKGANLNGDMLEQMREYSSVLAPLGYTAEEVMAKMANAGKDGVFNDKALDALKEGGLSLREMGKAQQDALAGIGLLPSDLKDKTIKQAIETVGAAMEASGATVAQKQAVVADIFRGAGEDMGSFLVEGLMSSQTLDSMPAVEQAGSFVKGFMADVQSFTAQTFGSLAIATQQLAPAFDVIGGAVLMFGQLSKVTWVQTVATKALSVATGIMNAVSAAGPWGWVAIAIGAVVGVVTLLSEKFEWAAGIVEGVKNSFMDFGKVLLNIVLVPAKQVLGVLGAIGSAVANLIDGNWSGAFDAVKSVGTAFIDPLLDVKNSAQTAVSNFASGYERGAAQLKKKKADEALVLNKPQSTIEAIKNDGSTITNVTGNAKGNAGGASKMSNGLSGTGGGGKALTMNLTINNHFSNVKSDLDIRAIADKVAGVIVDRVRDASLSLG